MTQKKNVTQFPYEKQNPLTINITVQDLHDKYLPLIRSERIDFSNATQAAMDLLGEGELTYREMGECLTIAREIGVLQDTKGFWDNKRNLSEGSGMSIRFINRAKREQYKVDGQTFSLRQFVGRVQVKDYHSNETQAGNELESNQGLNETHNDSDKTFVETGSKAGMYRAIKYMEKVIPGHIFEHLVIIAVNGGDVQKYADGLKGKIDEIVEKIPNSVE